MSAVSELDALPNDLSFEKKSSEQKFEKISSADLERCKTIANREIDRLNLRVETSKTQYNHNHMIEIASLIVFTVAIGLMFGVSFGIGLGILSSETFLAIGGIAGALLLVSTIGADKFITKADSAFREMNQDQARKQALENAIKTILKPEATFSLSRNCPDLRTYPDHDLLNRLYHAGEQPPQYIFNPLAYLTQVATP